MAPACALEGADCLSSTRKWTEVCDVIMWIDRRLARLSPIFPSKSTAFHVASVAALTGIADEQNRLPKKFRPLDLALLGMAAHKLSRIVAKDRITSILRAPFVTYIRSAGAGEVEEEPRGRGVQRGIGQLISCPYCVAPWCARALAFGFIFAPRAARFFAGILASVAMSDFLHRAYLAAKEKI